MKGQSELSLAIVYLLYFISKEISKQNIICKAERSNVNVPNVTILLNQVEAVHGYLIYCFLNISFLKYSIIKSKSFKRYSINEEGKETEKSPLGKCRSNDCRRQDPLTDSKISDDMVKRNRTFEQSQSISSRGLICYQGKHTNFTVEKPSRCHLINVFKVGSITSDKIRAHHKALSARHCKRCSSCPECITSFKSKTVEHSPEKLTGILQKCQDHERKENSEELSETQEKKQLNPNENLYKILVQKKQKDITEKIGG